MTDEMLIERAQAGDSSAVVALYECYKQRVLRYLFYRLGDVYLAEDLTTEVFIRVIHGLPRFRWQDVPVQAWIFQIARNLATDQLRKRKMRVQVHLDESLADRTEAPDIAAERSLTNDHLQAALQELTDDQRDVIVLRFIEGISVAEVAQALNKTESAVKNLQIRGLKALYRLLSPQKAFYD
jgi:RNA polymerase sigma-70 factor (ECF subfamily)